jgi:hypothetical protein
VNRRETTVVGLKRVIRHWLDDNAEPHGSNSALDRAEPDVYPNYGTK